MVFIPEDVYRIIAGFLPQEDLCRMIEVSSAMFHLAMNARYRSVTFARFDDATLKKMQRLRDPAVAPRVRHLHVNPYYKQGSLDLDSNGKRRTESIYTAPWREVLRSMNETVSLFSNVTEFSVDWISDPYPYDLPEYLPEYLPMFFTIAFMTFAHGLRKATFELGLRHCTMLLPSARILPALQELEFVLYNMDAGSDAAYRQDVMTTTVAAFINKVAPTLRILSLSAFSRLSKWQTAFDCSSLFNSVGNIPNLEKLSFRSNTTCVACTTRVVGNRKVAKTAFVRWMEENKSDTVILSNLLTMDITLPGELDIALEFIHHSADTLTSLSLFGCSLRHDQVDTVLSIFGHRREEQRLEELSLCPRFLSSELVLMLARMLPYLRKLTLHVLSVEQELQQWKEPRSEAEKLMNMDFPHELEHTAIQSWRLYDITITTSRNQRGKVDMMLMHLFTELVPCIKRVSQMEKELFQTEIFRSLQEDITET